MRIFRWLFVLSLLIGGSRAYAQEEQSIDEVPTSVLAQKIRQYAMEHGTIIIIDRSVYELTLWAREGGNVEGLSVTRYLTTEQLDNFPTPGHVVANEFIWGRPKIHIEQTFADTNTDGTVDIYQMFTKQRHPGHYEGFTREERDRGKKAGVSEELYMQGEVRRSRGIFFWRSSWRKATTEEQAIVTKEYRSHLESLVVYLGL